MNKKVECAAFFHRVLRDQKLPGWTLEWYADDSTEGYCWLRDQRVRIGPGGTVAQIQYRILHEIAHIRIGQPIPHGNKHDREFFRRLRNLLDQYLDGAPFTDHDVMTGRVYKVIDGWPVENTAGGVYPVAT